MKDRFFRYAVICKNVSDKACDMVVEITLAVDVISDGCYAIAYALCGEQDQFNRAIGKTIALRRLEIRDVVTLSQKDLDKHSGLSQAFLANLLLSKNRPALIPRDVWQSLKMNKVAIMSRKNFMGGIFNASV
jgi:predicted DsbA family dithiol-disulfide isomerase